MQRNISWIIAVTYGRGIRLIGRESLVFQQEVILHVKLQIYSTAILLLLRVPTAATVVFLKCQGRLCHSKPSNGFSSHSEYNSKSILLFFQLVFCDSPVEKCSLKDISVPTPGACECYHGWQKKKKSLQKSRILRCRGYPDTSGCALNVTDMSPYKREAEGNFTHGKEKAM